MKNVQLVQLNNSYGDQVYLPYSVGMLTAYAEKSQKIRENIHFQDFIFLRESIDVMLEKVGDADVVGISCYVWNWELSVKLAEAVKQKNSNCIVVLGGPHVPDNDSELFDKYPLVDVLCHGEGEATFLEILERVVDSESLQGIPGTTLNSKGTALKGPPRSRITDLDTIPSPYLTGVFGRLLSDRSYKWMVTWETNRGCPFKCSFCDWGSAIATKVRKFSEDRLFDEIKYFSHNQIELVFGADANFGIFKRDKDFALRLAKYKTETGWPNQFRVCFTKNSTDKIFDLAKIFADAGMNKGVSVSMQSMNPQTLKDIQRANIRLNVFKDLQKKYVAAGLVTYTELILPLPGETYDTFVSGINELLDSAQHSGIVIYNCTVMPNAEMGSKEYQEEHGFDLVTIPIFQAHSSARSDDVVEKETIIVGTSAMPREQWKKTFRFAWAIQCFHLLGLLQPTAIVLRHRYNIEYGTFYSSLLEYFEGKDDTVIGSEILRTDKLIEGVLNGFGFDQYVPGFLDISWPAEEASFLRISNNLNEFHDQIELFINDMYNIGHRQIMHDLLEYQKNIIVSFNDKPEINNEFELDCDMHTYFSNLRAGKVSSLDFIKTKYTKNIKTDYSSDKPGFSREIVWYGRKGGKFFNELVKA